MLHPQNPFLEASWNPLLGTTAKLSSALGLQTQTEQEKRVFENAKNRVQIDRETGEILGPARAFDSMVAKCDRFILQSVVRRLMGSSRTAKCLRFRQPGHDVEVFRSLEYRIASYGGLQTCGSVWACPVCAAKIAERRRVEIQTAMAAHVAVGGNFALLTLTIPHQVVDALPDLLQKLASAKARFFGHRAVRRVLVEMGFVGQISALEVTHGRKSGRNNGWHPHPHILLFTRYGLGIDPHWTSPLCSDHPPEGETRASRFLQARSFSWTPSSTEEALLYHTLLHLCQVMIKLSHTMHHYGACTPKKTA